MIKVLMVSIALVATVITTGNVLAAPGPGAEGESKPFELPLAALAMLHLEAASGTCEISWPEYASQIGVITDELSDGTTLYLVPCALWTHNLAWMAFVKIDRPNHAAGALILPMRFVDYSPYEGVVARSVIHNARWDSKSQTLHTRFFLNGKEQCGSIGEYRWNDDQRGLLLKTLIKQDICDGEPAEWSAVVQ